VLGGLRVRDAQVVAGLLALLDSDLAALQRHALAALTGSGTTKLLPRALALIFSAILRAERRMGRRPSP